jgi:hypothetical protein
MVRYVSLWIVLFCLYESRLALRASTAESCAVKRSEGAPKRWAGRENTHRIGIPRVELDLSLQMRLHGSQVGEAPLQRLEARQASGFQFLAPRPRGLWPVSVCHGGAGGHAYLFDLLCDVGDGVGYRLDRRGNRVAELVQGFEAPQAQPQLRVGGSFLELAGILEVAGLLPGKSVNSASPGGSGTHHLLVELCLSDKVVDGLLVVRHHALAEQLKHQ